MTSNIPWEVESFYFQLLLMQILTVGQNWFYWVSTRGGIYLPLLTVRNGITHAQKLLRISLMMTSGAMGGAFHWFYYWFLRTDPNQRQPITGVHILCRNNERHITCRSTAHSTLFGQVCYVTTDVQKEWVLHFDIVTLLSASWSIWQPLWMPVLRDKVERDFIRFSFIIIILRKLPSPQLLFA